MYIRIYLVTHIKVASIANCFVVLGWCDCRWAYLHFRFDKRNAEIRLAANADGLVSTIYFFRYFFKCTVNCLFFQLLSIYSLFLFIVFYLWIYLFLFFCRGHTINCRMSAPKCMPWKKVACAHKKPTHKCNEKSATLLKSKLSSSLLGLKSNIGYAVMLLRFSRFCVVLYFRASVALCNLTGRYASLTKAAKYFRFCIFMLVKKWQQHEQ